MYPILRIELLKIFRQPRTYIAFVAIAAIVLLVQLALYMDGEQWLSFGMQSLTSNFSIEGKILNGYLVCFVVLQTLLIHVPLLVALVAGDLVAGEANMGTLRLLVSKPISRVRLMLSKYCAALAYTILLLIWMAILALLISLLLFGVGDLIILKSDEVVILEKSDVLWRYFAAFGYAALAMSAVAALAFMLSVFAENSIGPIVATMSVVIVFTILSTMDIPIFNAIKPWLFTSHMIGWKGFFDNPIQYHAVLKSALVLLAHIALFVGVAVFVFKRKDILS
jgi:ABC-2 type transport system permease protein